MELDMSSKNIKELAREIALASLTIADETIDSEVSKWSETVKATYRIPAPGDTTRDGRVITQQERWEAFRAARAGAEGQLAREQQEAETAKAEMDASIARREADDAATIERNKLQNKATLAKWEADKAVAKANGYVEPTRPDNLLLPETDEGLAQAAYRQHAGGI